MTPLRMWPVVVVYLTVCLAMVAPVLWLPLVGWACLTWRRRRRGHAGWLAEQGRVNAQWSARHAAVSQWL